MSFFKKIAVLGLCCGVLSVASASFSEIRAEESAAPAPAPVPEEEASSERFATSRSAYFYVSAESSESAVRTAELAKQIEAYFLKNSRLWRKYFTTENLRINVELFTQPGVCRISQSETGVVTLFLSEGDPKKDNLALRTHLANALLVRILPGMAKNPQSVPAWIAVAIAEESTLGSVPGRQIALRKRSERIRPVVPEKILGATLDDLWGKDPTLRINALWFLRSLSTLEPFLRTGIPAKKQLTQAFPKVFEKGKYDPVVAARFWATRFCGLLAAAPGGIDLPDESRKFFDDSLLFLIEKDGKDTRVLAGDLVAFRLQKEIRDYVEARFADYAGGFKRANPVWFNAFAEYGLFLEMFGNPDVSDATLIAQWRKALMAREEAIALQDEVRAALLAH